MQFSVEDRVNIIKLHYQGNSTRDIRTYFLGFYPNENVPARETIRLIIKQFENTACANKSHGKTNKQNLNEETEFNVLAKIQENARVSVRQIADEIDSSKSHVLRILKKNKFHSYKIQEHQDLLMQDMEARQTFSEINFEKVNWNALFLKYVCFTDECTFHQTMVGNKQNDRLWSQDNPRVQKITRTQYPRKVNVWAGILGKNIIGPFFIDGTLNGEKYLELLNNDIGPEILEAIENYDRQIYYQQDECPAHNTKEVR